LDERLGFGELIAQHLTDSRRGKNAPKLPVGTRLEGGTAHFSWVLVPLVQFSGGALPKLGRNRGGSMYTKPNRKAKMEISDYDASKPKLKFRFSPLRDVLRIRPTRDEKALVQSTRGGARQ